MTSTDDRHGEAPTVVELPDLLAQIHDRAAETAGHDVAAGTARLTAWMGQQRQYQVEPEDSTVRHLPARAASIDPARRHPKSDSEHKQRRGPAVKRRKRASARTARVGVMAAAQLGGRREPADAQSALHRDSVQVGFLGFFHLRARFGPASTRVVAMLAHAVVAVVAVLHDPQWAILTIAGLCSVYLVILAAVVTRALGPDPSRRHDSRRVLLLLLGREQGAQAERTGDTYVTVNGKARIGD